MVLRQEAIAGVSGTPALSANGHVVAYVSSATNLIPTATARARMSTRTPEDGESRITGSSTREERRQMEVPSRSLPP
jgi:hypothetical protein